MKFIILGSGGFQTIPIPTCQCRVCKEARKKGVPYSRNGPSIFIDDINAIIDTPKDIINSINREDIKKVERVFFTHWHPDHTEGFRLAEEITDDWTAHEPYELKNEGEPIKYIAPKEVMKDLKNIRSPLDSFLAYRERMRFLKLMEIESDKEYKIRNLTITAEKIRQYTNANVCAYIIKEGNKKVVYFPCHTKAWKNDSRLKDADLLIMNNPWFSPLSKGQEITENHPLRHQLFSMEELIEQIKKLNIKKTIIIHIEEMWGKSYDDYCKLEEKYKDYNIKFAFDGMRIEV